MKNDPSSYSLLSQISLGEDSTRQFKADVRNGESLASEMAAFANSNGGTIFIGVADDGSSPGLSQKDVSRINQIISNAASQLVRSLLTVQSENVAIENGRIVIVLTVPKGIDKPYFDKNGVIWLKTGADKRRVNSKEELRRLFQMSAQFHADELPTKAGIDKLDKLRFRNFLRDIYKQEYPDSPAELTRLLQNMNLATDDGNLNLAGVLMFAEQPEWIVPQFVVKAIRYPGNKIHATDYVDTNIRNPILVSYVAKGLLPYHGLGSDIKRTLEGWSQIDFVDDHDGCLFTATVHRKAVEELELANKGALKVQIKGQDAALSGQPDPTKGSLPDNVLKRTDHNVGKTSGKILETCRERSAITIPELAALIGITERSAQRNIQKLQADGLLRRVGGRKAGHWEVPEWAAS